jgi:hypothetical protein
MFVLTGWPFGAMAPMASCQYEPGGMKLLVAVRVTCTTWWSRSMAVVS